MKFLLVLLALSVLALVESKSIRQKRDGLTGVDLPGQDTNCGPSNSTSPDECKTMCYLVPGCTHYTWFFRDNQQNCCLKNGPRSYSSLVDRPDLAPIVSEILSGANGFDLPGQDTNCGPANPASPDECRSMCLTTQGCTHYTWFFRDNQQNCCLKNGARSYSSQVARPDLAPIFSEILVEDAPVTTQAPTTTAATVNEQTSGVSGFDLPGQDMSCGPSSAAGPDQCKESCETTPGCTHYTWFFRDGHQNCCIKDGPRSYSSLVEQPDLAPIISEILPTGQGWFLADCAKCNWPYAGYCQKQCGGAKREAPEIPNMASNYDNSFQEFIDSITNGKQMPGQFRCVYDSVAKSYDYYCIPDPIIGQLSSEDSV